MAFSGKTVWITGASSGIGEALAHAFARRGARLILSARRGERLEAVRAACTSPASHLVHVLDLAATDTLEAAAEAVLAASGGVDVLVLNAGISQRALAADTRLEVDRRLFEVNYFGTIALTKAVLPSMLRRGGGEIVVVTSLVGKIGTPLRSSYAASKHALHGFFDSLRAEVWRQGVRVRLICPGFVRTEISQHALTADGTPQGTMDQAQANGLDPAVCAERTVRAVERGRDELLVGGKEVWAVRLARWCPPLFRRLIRTAKVT